MRDREQRAQTRQRGRRPEQLATDVVEPVLAQNIVAGVGVSDVHVGAIDLPGHAERQLVGDQRPGQGHARAGQIMRPENLLRHRVPVEGRVPGLDEDRAGRGVAPLQGRLRAAQHFDLLDVPYRSHAATYRFCVLHRAVHDHRDHRRGVGALVLRQTFRVDAADGDAAVVAGGSRRDRVRRRIDRFVDILNLLLLDALAGDDADAGGGPEIFALDLLAGDVDRSSTIEPGVAPLAPASCAEGPTSVTVVGPVMLAESPLPRSSRRNASAGVMVPTTGGDITREAIADE